MFRFILKLFKEEQTFRDLSLSTVIKFDKDMTSFSDPFQIKADVERHLLQ